MALLKGTRSGRSLLLYRCVVAMMIAYSIFSTISTKLGMYNSNGDVIIRMDSSSIYDAHHTSNTTDKMPTELSSEPTSQPSSVPSLKPSSRPSSVPSVLPSSIVERNSTLISDALHASNTTYKNGSKNNTVGGGGTNTKKVSLVFVTASSANHMLALLLDHLPSIERWVLNTTTPTFLPTLEGESAPTKADLSVRVIHYNLDLVEHRALKENQDNIQKLRNKFPYVELREFDYAAHQSYFNISRARGEYAFKPVIVEQVARELQSMDAGNTTGATSNNENGDGYAQSYLYWLDAGARIRDGRGPFQKDFQIAKTQGIYTPVSAGPLKRWTVKGTAEYLKLDPEIYASPKTRIVSANMILLDLKNQTIYKNVIEPWMNCAEHKECIAPEGKRKIYWNHTFFIV